jgi:outer membrane receptor protein involved in Fe transport
LEGVFGQCVFALDADTYVALRAEYQYEKIDRDAEFVAGIRQVKTHRFPLGVRLFHPSGLSAGLTATYYNQDGQFQRQIAPPGFFESGKDNFWLVDGMLSYRLPKRYGFLTLGVRNLFDKKFNYYDTDPVNPVIQPDRAIFGKITLAFP